ncbi:MAG: homoserine O-succinyltransferase [Muribaculaceae bacterium]|nr:homoserine O-succinyltransferase [Muribaculaceae bacterium]
MSVKVPVNLPAVELLKNENIFLNEEHQSPMNARTLRIGIVNLMPLKEQTETDFLRMLSNSPLPLEVDLIDMASHISKNTPHEHLEKFYKYFDDIREANYDGLIITGAPVEKLRFEDVDYWEELTEIMDWAKNHVNSTLYICWAAFAGLYHHYGIPKVDTDKKLSGVYPHRVLAPQNPLLRGFDDIFYVPHSRFTGVRFSDVKEIPELSILSDGDAVGPYIIMGRDGREFYITGHSEYSPYTLKKEYERDIKKGLNPIPPENYFLDDDVEKRVPVVRWRSHANLLFTNWINYFVYRNSANKNG